MIVGISMLTNTLNEIKKYQNEILNLTNEMQKSFIINFEKDLQTLKTTFPNLDVVYIIGFTPEWNDGEECYHESDVYIDGTSLFNGISSVFDRLYDCYDVNNQSNLDEHVPKYLHHINKKLKNSELEKINEFFRKYSIEDTLQTVFNTNWIITIDFRGDNVVITKDDYECGY